MQNTLLFDIFQDFEHSYNLVNLPRKNPLLARGPDFLPQEYSYSCRKRNFLLPQEERSACCKKMNSPLVRKDPLDARKILQEIFSRGQILLVFQCNNKIKTITNSALKTTAFAFPDNAEDSNFGQNVLLKQKAKKIKHVENSVFILARKKFTILRTGCLMYFRCSYLKLDSKMNLINFSAGDIYITDIDTYVDHTNYKKNKKFSLLLSEKKKLSRNYLRSFLIVVDLQKRILYLQRMKNTIRNHRKIHLKIRQCRHSYLTVVDTEKRMTCY